MRLLKLTIILILLHNCVRDPSNDIEFTDEPEVGIPESPEDPTSSPTSPGSLHYPLSGKSYSHLRLLREQMTEDYFFSPSNYNDNPKLSHTICSEQPYKVFQIGSQGIIVTTGTTDQVGSFTGWVPEDKEVLIEIPECGLKCVAKAGESNLICDPYMDAVIKYFERELDLTLLDSQFDKVPIASLITAATMILKIDTFQRADFRFSSHLALCRKSSENDDCTLKLMENSSIKSFLHLTKGLIIHDNIDQQGIPLHHARAYEEVFNFAYMIDTITALGMSLNITDDLLRDLNVETFSPSLPVKIAEDAKNTLLTTLQGNEDSLFHHSHAECVQIIRTTSHKTEQVSYFSPTIDPALLLLDATVANICPNYTKFPYCNEELADSSTCISNYLVFMDDYPQSSPLIITLGLDKLIHLTDSMQKSTPSKFSLKQIQSLGKELFSLPNLSSDELDGLLITLSNFPTYHLLKNQTVEINTSINENPRGLSSFEVVAHTIPFPGEVKKVPLFCEIPDLMNGHLGSNRIFCTRPADYSFSFDQYTLINGSPQSYMLSFDQLSSKQGIYRVLYPNGLPVKVEGQLLLVQEINPAHSTCKQEESEPLSHMMEIHGKQGIAVFQKVLIICKEFNFINKDKNYRLTAGNKLTSLIEGEPHQFSTVVLPSIDQKPSQQQLCIFDPGQAMKKGEILDAQIELVYCHEDHPRDLLYYLTTFGSSAEEDKLPLIPISFLNHLPIFRDSRNPHPILHEIPAPEILNKVLQLPISFLTNHLTPTQLEDIRTFRHEGVSSILHENNQDLAIFSPYYDDFNQDQEWNCMQMDETTDGEYSYLSQLTYCSLKKSKMEQVFAMLPPSVIGFFNQNPDLLGLSGTEIPQPFPDPDVINEFGAYIFSCLDGSRPSKINLDDLQGAGHTCGDTSQTIRIRNIYAKPNTTSSLSPKALLRQSLFAYRFLSFNKAILETKKQFAPIDAIALYASFLNQNRIDDYNSQLSHFIQKLFPK